MRLSWSQPPIVDPANVAITGGTATNLTSLSLTSGSITTGTYTPTLTLVANAAAATAVAAQYMQVGDMVSVSGRINVDPTTASTLTSVGISLPVASNLGSGGQCAGTASLGILSYSGGISTDAVNHRAQLDFLCGTDAANRSWEFQFMYRVI
jgi:hypothetical protein